MVGVIDSIARQDSDQLALLGLWAVSGVLALLAFVLPDTLGTALTGRGVITVAMTFIGSGLVYLAALPLHADRASGQGG